MYDYEVRRMFYSRRWFGKIGEWIRKLPIRKQDILIIIEDENMLPKIKYDVDLQELYNKPRQKTWIYDNMSLHVNSVANKAIAQEIYDVWLKQKCEELEQIPENIWIQKGELFDGEWKERILKYVDTIRAMSEMEQIGKKIGAIVMNCNPFTNGHKFLIESAVKQVDFLYIFLVEENKSIFPYELRKKLVTRGENFQLKNIAVVPSGNFVLSYMTLSVYFEKAERQEERVDASKDIEIFARYVAPKLGITCRFVGEEPTDLVTRQYNKQMASLLPEFGIEFIEVARTSSIDGKIISASTVRKYLKNEDWEELKKFVPETTYDVLWKLKQNRCVVYGAGKRGKEVYNFLQNINAKIVGWLDKNHTQFDKNVEAPEELLHKYYEYIIVVVESEELFQKIRRDILKIDGTAEHKIVKLYDWL